MTCKIADLGFSRKLEINQVAKTSCGTPLLMAPEILNNKGYDHKVDVWSIGCLYFQLLTGSFPFTGRTLPEFRNNLNNGRYAIPSGRISDQGIKFLTEMLMHDAETRISWENLYRHEYI